MKKESMSRIERRKAQQRKKTPVQWKKSTTLFSSALIVSSVGTPVALLPVTAEATEEHQQMRKLPKHLLRKLA